MLTEIQIENFKAFGSRVTIPLAPITLIFGENSAGKSSILQCLNLLKQTLEARDANAVLLPRAENGLVDLGSFQDILFDHELERVFSVRLTSTIRAQMARPFDFRDERKGDTTTSIEFSWKRPSLDKEVTLNEIKLFTGGGQLHVCTFKVDPVKTISERFAMRYAPRAMHDSSPLRAANCSWITDDKEFWTPFCAHAMKERTNIQKKLKNHGETYKRGPFDDPSEKTGESKFRKLLERASKLFSKNFDIKKFISLITAFEKCDSVGLDGFCPAVLDRAALERAFFFQDGRIRPGKGGDFFPHFSSNLLFAAHAVTADLESLFPLGPFRRPPERWYVFSGTNPQDVGYRGDLLPALLYRNQEALDGTNEWLARLGIGYQLKLQAVGSEIKDLFAVRLQDKRRTRNVEVSLSDVGFGISQLLPFVVQALSAQEQTITIEQPEVHIHPRLQADLGDLLAECIKKPRNNRFIIETHSEHLVLRMQRLVRRGSLNPEDVSIIYVKHGCDGAKVTRLNLDREGDFLDDWPGGFFPERLRELGDD